jgi:hypothetical protein
MLEKDYNNKASARTSLIVVLPDTVYETTCQVHMVISRVDTSIFGHLTP